MPPARKNATRSLTCLTPQPFWKRTPKKVDEFVEWSRVMEALGEKDDEVLLEDKSVMTLSF